MSKAISRRDFLKVSGAVGAAGLLAACGASNSGGGSSSANSGTESALVLSDQTVTLNGSTVSQGTDGAVTVSHDIIYYQADQGEDYGEGSADDEHTADEADAHTVVTIRKAGTYRVSGSLSAGQLAVDLGDDAKTDPSSVVTLILDGVDITCTVAPAVIFYSVYECDADFVAYDSEETDNYVSSPTVDTSAAGANVILADGSVNNISGSYVARIYKEGTTKKLHKYDGAFYSKMSMNVSGGEAGTGTLEIVADNEGLDSELHLTINSGNIHILAGNDGINTNEDGVSVTTINGGTLRIEVTGETGEGDGIDSNGWLVINGGMVIAAACSDSADSGLDSDNGIYINGGIVIASGNMYDAVDGGNQTYAVFQFAQKQSGGQTYTLKNAAGETVLEMTPENAFQYLVVSAPGLAEGEYTLWCGDTQLGASTGSVGGPSGGMGRPDGQPPEGAPGQKPEGADDGQQPPEPPADGQRPEGGPNGAMDGGNSADAAECSDTFTLQSGANQFTNVGALT